MWIITRQNNEGDVIAVNSYDIRTMTANEHGCFANLTNGETIKMSEQNTIEKIIKAASLHLPALNLSEVVE